MDYIVNSFANIRISDVIDMVIVGFFTYNLLLYIRRTRAMQVLKGLIVVLVIWAIAEVFSFSVVTFMIRNFMTLGIIFLVIVFQPELRLGLEKLGRGGNIVTSGLTNPKPDDADKMLPELLMAVDEMAKQKTGAIIAIEVDSPLDDIIDTGERISAIASSSLIKNIFFKNAPLHDGAMIIRNSTIIAAACILPLSRNFTLSKDLGTRHRAALGLSERSDAIVIVISEETGTISVCIDGRLTRFVDLPGLESLLRSKITAEKKSKMPFMELFENLFRAKRE